MRFGRFRIDPQRLVLEHDGRQVALAPKSVELLAALIERSGDVVAKRELLDRIWPESAVEEANLSQHVYIIRKTLRSLDPLAGEMLVTVPKRGYRFVQPEPEPDCRTEQMAQAAAPPARARFSIALSTRRIAAALVALFVLSAAGSSFRGSVRPATGLSPEGMGAARLGRYYLDLRTPLGIRRGRDYFTRVIASDPNSPTGYAGLADALTLTADYGVGTLPSKTYLDRALVAARHAVALDSQSAEAHASLGAIAQHRDDMAAAKTEFERAVALDRNYAPAHHWLGTLLFDQGDFPGSWRELTLASQLNPVSTATSAWLEEAAYLLHRYDTAIEHGRRATELDPSRRDALRELGLAYQAKGNYRAALRAFERMPRSGAARANVAFLVAGVYAREGRPEVARQIIAGVRRDAAVRHDAAVATELPFTLLALGQTGEAARIARKLHFSDCGERMQFTEDPRFDAVRADAAFTSVLGGRCVAHG